MVWFVLVSAMMFTVLGTSVAEPRFVPPGPEHCQSDLTVVPQLFAVLVNNVCYVDVNQYMVFVDASCACKQGFNGMHGGQLYRDDNFTKVNNSISKPATEVPRTVNIIAETNTNHTMIACSEIEKIVCRFS